MKVALGRAAVASMFLSAAAWSAAPASEPPTDWVDPATGHRIVRLSTEAGTRSIYFHQNSITPDGRFILVEMTDGLGVIEIATRRNIKLVDGKARALFVGRRTGLVYFSRGENAGRPEQQKQVGIYSVKPTGGKPNAFSVSRRGLSRRLTKSCVVRVPGPPRAKLTAPRRFVARTLSSGRRRSRHAAATVGSAGRPNCATKPGTTRKKRAPS